jgi:phage terminase Nu1 subunit (DNA packaging protein)
MVAKRNTGKRTVAAGVVAAWVGVATREVIARWGKQVDIAAFAVDAWKHPPAVIARTYRELAEQLGLTCADPERTLKQYVARGMPGKAARPGKRDGQFDVEVCRSWIAVHVRGGGASAESGDLRERILQLELEITERDKLEQLGRLADVDEVAAFAATCVANARAILEAIPDEVLSRLDGVDEVRRKSIHAKVTELVDTAFEELARLNEGDDDPTEDDAATRAGHAPAAGKVA